MYSSQYSKGGLEPSQTSSMIASPTHLFSSGKTRQTDAAIATNKLGLSSVAETQSHLQKSDESAALRTTLDGQDTARVSQSQTSFKRIE